MRQKDDLISRQALCEYALNQKDKSITPNDIMRFPSAQPETHDKRTKTHACDLISRQAAIEAMGKAEWAKERLRELPSAEPEIKPISYEDCANAMLMMWMDNVVTDGEYSRIMDKLNKFEVERRTDE